MMGRLSGYDERENGNVAQGNFNFQAEQSGRVPNIPAHQSYCNVSLPHIQEHYHLSPINRPQSTTVERVHSSFQETLQPVSVREPRPIRSCTTSPTFKLPPVPSSKPGHKSTNNMPPRGSAEVAAATFEPIEAAEIAGKAPPLDIKTAYENMMIGYFMPAYPKANMMNTSMIKPPDEVLQVDSINTNQFVSSQNSKMFSVQGSQQMFQYIPQFSETSHSSYGSLPQDFYQTFQTNQIPVQDDNKPNNSTLQNPSGNITSKVSPSNVNSNSFCVPSASSNLPCPSSDFVSEPNQSEISAMESALNDFSMFMPSQQAQELENLFRENSMRTSSSTSTSSIVTTTTTCATEAASSAFPNVPYQTASSSAFPNVPYQTASSSSFSNVPYQTKAEPNWGRFSVLPPVNPSATPSTVGFGDGDNASLLSYASISGNAQAPYHQAGFPYNNFSPLSSNFTDGIPSAFTTSPRYSARSSYSSRSRNKRALSNSPLSAEGIDINAIIRMSPTSLNAYLNGSRSSSSCVSPGSLGDKTGCYGHLSARNSSSSPNSGSGSSGNRRSASFTPQTGTPHNSSNPNITSDSSNASLACSNSERIKNDLINIDDNLLLMQAMQDLEAGAGLPLLSTNVIPDAEMPSDFENLQVLPQDLATFHTEDYIPFIPSVLPPVHTHLHSPYQQPPTQMLSTLVAHTKPPPTYDQHMARKATLQKNSSSDSSQPSNSNSSSFESSEGDKTVAGSSGTDTESNRMYACRWLDCAAIFQDQDEFVTHIEKIHIDQKKGEDFVCFWKLCPRRLHPFNARYKLLVHMRIHSGDKPNKCTYSGCTKAFSRLENLKIHLRSHTGERPYSCSFPGCAKTFSNSSDRTKHQKTHHETKPYVCQFSGCEKRYTDPSSLRKHVKKSHPDKKEPDRKKIRGTAEELDPKDLSECLVIQSIKPMSLYDASPPEPTDSGLGRSPRSSQPGSSSDHYPGLVYSGGEVQGGTSSQTSPSSQHSSPPAHFDREKLPPNNNSLRVPVLPPITPSPVQSAFPSLKSSTPTVARGPSSSASSISRNSSSLLHRPKLEVGRSNPHPSTSPNSRSSMRYQ